MQHYQNHWSFGPEQRGEDGVVYNFQFDRYADALHAWRYPDLTRHVAFLADTLPARAEFDMVDDGRGHDAVVRLLVTLLPVGREAHALDREVERDDVAEIGVVLLVVFEATNNHVRLPFACRTVTMTILVARVTAAAPKRQTATK